MTGFLTVEDVNSILYEYGCVSVFHEIDTSLITDEYDFDGIRYDFCTVSRETDGNEYNYTFKIENTLWTGGYYVLDGNDDYVDSDATYNSSTKVLSITTNTPTIKLFLYLSNIPQSFYLDRLTWIIKENNNKRVSMLNSYIAFGHYLTPFDRLEIIEFKPYTASNVKYSYWYWLNTQINTTNLPVISENNKKYIDLKKDYLMCFVQISDANGKNRLFWDNGDLFETKTMTKIKFSNDKLIIGKINELQITNTDTSVLNKGILKYDGIEEVIDLTGTVSSQKPKIDLRNKTDLGNIKFQIYSNAYEGNFDWEYNFSLPCAIFNVSTLSDLVSECGDTGGTIIEFGEDLTLTNNISITHNIIIDGKDHTIDLNQMGFILSENINVTFKNINFINGDTAITQNKGTELRLENCSFTNCTSSNYNNLGSCIYCDMDIESLSNPNDFVTVIDNCCFVDNHNCILSGGKLTVNNSRLHNTDTDYIDKHNVAFLYQTDGNAVLKHNIFDIDYDTDELCSNEQNIGFAQALIQIGTTARVNGATSTQLLEDNKLPFSDNVYQNSSHIFAKYYYPQIESCVYTSPMLDKEDKALCYVVSGENWIWKQNVQVTRASWESENRIRKITWEE